VAYGDTYLCSCCIYLYVAIVKKYLITNILLLSFCTFVYSVNIWFKQQPLSEGFPFIRNHLNDTMAMVVVLSCTSITLNISKINNISSLKLIIHMCAFCGILWEFVAPLIKPNSVTDYWDILCYYIGGLIYYLIIKILSYSSGNTVIKKR
jgi:hypothetical protein